MRYDPTRHHRQSIRLKGYNYSLAGAYFVTLCVQNRESLLGEIVDGSMRLNDAGQMVERWWEELNRKFPTAGTDEYAIMPNHFHGVLVLYDDAGRGLERGERGEEGGRPPQEGGQPRRVAPTTDPTTDRLVPTTDRVALTVDPREPAADGTTDHAVTLADIVAWFKTMTTNEYIRGVKELSWPPFSGRFWQRNYYERIVRSEAELNRIREYIVSNAARWAEDRENPLAQRPGLEVL